MSTCSQYSINRMQARKMSLWPLCFDLDQVDCSTNNVDCVIVAKAFDAQVVKTGLAI